MDSENISLERRLRQEILFARQRVYQAGQPTPLEKLDTEYPFDLYLKREDVSPIRAYKWRGAYNRMALLSEQERVTGVVTASAGNHAQGVALAARLLKTSATIYMPRSTPSVKQSAVEMQGGEHVSIVLAGDAYDHAVTAAQEDAERSGKTYIHAYDDIHVMGGQGTLADEIVMSGKGPFDIAFLQIGGGGMAAAVACWLKTYYPTIKIVGVEGEDQASMKAAVAAGRPTRLASLDIFCDGTAVRQAGDLTFEICNELIDEYVTVSNDAVCEAMHFLWNTHRCVSEPAGALGVAAALEQRDTLAGKKVLTVLCGANIDFSQLGAIATSAGTGQAQRHYLRIEIEEKPGTMLNLLDVCLHDINIIDFQYGKTHQAQAWPIFGLSATDEDLATVKTRLKQHGFSFTTIDANDDVHFRVIPYRDELMKHPLFLKLEFYERRGALHDFLSQRVRGSASFCYFNYNYSGERVGRALIGFEFNSPQERSEFLKKLPQEGDGYRRCEAISAEVLARMVQVKA